MPTIQVEAQVSGQELLKAVEQLPPAEFQQFVADVLVIRAQRQAPRLSTKETDLLLHINQELPADLRQRSEQLIVKRREQTLTADEHAELLRLTEEVELCEARRLAALTELAQLRRTSLVNLMTVLGIRAPAHG